MAKSYHGGHTLYSASDFKNFIHDRHLGIEKDSSSSRAIDKKIEEYDEWKSELLEIMIQKLAIQIKCFAEKGNEINQSGQSYNKVFILHKKDWSEINSLHQLIADYKVAKGKISDTSWIKDLEFHKKDFGYKSYVLLHRMGSASRGFGVYSKYHEMNIIFRFLKNYY